jgi:hypothetical protein
VTLRDAAGNPILLHSATLQHTGAATVTPASASTDSSGAATFTVTDTTVEPATLSARDTTANPPVSVLQTAAVDFTRPSDEATASTVTASPASLPADGSHTSSVVVTLIAQGQPLAGHQVTLTARTGISRITTVTNPTGSDGRAVFQVTDTTPESITYTATDTTTGVAVTATTTVTFTPTSSGPSISSVSPTSGPTYGGTTVTIRGQNFARASAVRFGTASARFSVNSTGTSITATSPSGSGTVHISVTTPAGTSPSTPADQFTYGSSSSLFTPVVRSVSPSSGSRAGGTRVTISGSNLSGARSVAFGSAAATVVSVSSTSVVVTAPPGFGTVDVTVTTNYGTSQLTSADRYTYT